MNPLELEAILWELAYAVKGAPFTNGKTPPTQIDGEDISKAIKAINAHLYKEVNSLVGEEEPLENQSEYDKKHFGYPGADAEENLWMVRQATRDIFREEILATARRKYGGKRNE